MCIIAYRPENKTISEETLKTMFEANPNGAGIMYALDGKIHITKGLMTLEAFLNAARLIPEGVPAVYHCRIATHGSIRPGTCHPFPVTQNTELLNAPLLTLTKGYAVAHNGIISGMDCSHDFSDSQAFVRDILAPLAKCRSLHSKAFNPIITKAIDSSRLAILDTKGKVSLFGRGWTVDKGVFYSNTSYKPYRYVNPWRWDKKRRAYVNSEGKTWYQFMHEDEDSFDDYGTQNTLDCHGWGNGF